MPDASVGLVIQARMSSARLPGKVLRPLAGKPMLGWLLESMRRVRGVSRIVVATSVNDEDAGVEEYARSMQVSCFRGALDDVLSRFVGVCAAYDLDAAVRINGDSPFLDSAIVDRAVELFLSRDADLVTNVFPRSFPAGQSVEVIARSALERAADAATPYEKEHVTAHLYTHPADYRIVNFESPEAHADVHMAVDTASDFELAERMARAMTAPAASYDLAALIELRRAAASTPMQAKRCRSG